MLRNVQVKNECAHSFGYKQKKQRQMTPHTAQLYESTMEMRIVCWPGSSTKTEQFIWHENDGNAKRHNAKSHSAPFQEINALLGLVWMGTMTLIGF